MGEDIFHSEAVFVHGMFGQNGRFKSLSKALAGEKIRLHTPVLGGYSSDGLFVWFSRKGVLDRVHQSVLELKRITGEKPWLFGASLGTIIAVRYALLFPDTISGLILHTIVDLKDLSFVGLWSRLFLRLAKTFRGFAPLLYPMPFPLPWVLGMQTKNRLFYSAGGLMELFYGSKPFPDLGDVHVPVFLFVGSKDRLIPPRYCFEKFKQLKGPKAFSLIDGGTHGVLVTHPLDVSRQIAAWLKTGQEMRLR